jgi:hypothetical protein
VYRLALALAPAAGLLGSAPSAWAQAEISRWEVRGQGLWLTYRSDVSSGDQYTTEHHHFEQSAGLGLEAEIRAEPWLGFSFGMSASRLEVRTRSDGLFADPPRRSHFELYLPTVGVNLHPVPGSRADFYFGPTVSSAIFDQDRFDQLGRNDLAIGGVLGLDMAPARGGWGFTASVRYVRLPVYGFFNDEAYLYTYLLGAGASYRF